MSQMALVEKEDWQAVDNPRHDGVREKVPVEDIFRVKQESLELFVAAEVQKKCVPQWADPRHRLDAFLGCDQHGLPTRADGFLKLPKQDGIEPGSPKLG